jgi:hypothetical protein
MPTLAAITAAHAAATGAHRPLRTIELPPEAFADTREPRVRKAKTAGMRLLREGEVARARAEAAQYAWELHATTADVEGRIACYQDRLMTWIACAALCEPTDARVRFMDLSVETASETLTPAGVRLVFDTYERIVLETSPIEAELTEDDETELVERLLRDELSLLSIAPQRRARKLLHFVLQELRALDPADGADDLAAELMEEALTP